jgi:hypothetical protein
VQFREIAGAVQTQGVQLDTLEAHVAAVDEAVAEGTGELVEADKLMCGARPAVR